ncbi:hypothetical protein NQZ68_000903 [Dissostichus eleginoides]|nr:hypothetical protein NQZ68_000903 [Dissostichus eleginoides]
MERWDPVSVPQKDPSLWNTWGIRSRTQVVLDTALWRKLSKCSTSTDQPSSVLHVVAYIQHTGGTEITAVPSLSAPWPRVFQRLISVAPPNTEYYKISGESDQMTPLQRSAYQPADFFGSVNI